MSEQPWNETMPDNQFKRMRDILAAPSPVGLEGAMTYGVLEPMIQDFMPESWAIRQFQGNAGIVVDTDPDATDKLSVMVVGHADKIRMQVRSIGDDGKIWINSDSFLPTTLIGHEVSIFAEDTENISSWNVIQGGTVEAIGAIHFADSALRSGDKGIKKKQLYVELQLTGEDRKQQIEDLGIRTGNPILLDRPIKRGFGKDSFYGAYLDNGLGCFVTEEIARLVAEYGGFDNVRMLFAFAAYEEIGRFGSRVFAGELAPDVLVAVDVNHDYNAAPGIGDRRMPQLTMGEGFTLSSGAITSDFLNKRIEKAAKENEIPMQLDFAGRDTGTDAMAGVLASIDAAATSIGFPIRNMHTISESGHTGDVLASIHALYQTFREFDEDGVDSEQFRNGHARLDLSSPTDAQS